MHLDSIGKGSALVNIMVDDNDYSSVVRNIQDAHYGRGSKARQEAYERILNQVDQDGYDAEIISEGGKIVSFPTRLKASKASLLTQIMQTSMKGRLYSIGGKDETIPVRLESATGGIIFCQATQELAMNLGKDLFSYIHVHGKGEWIESKKGGWRLKMLTIESYEVIDNVSPKRALDRLKKLGGIKKSLGKNIHKEILDGRATE